MNKGEEENKKKEEILNDLKNNIQIGITLAIFLPVLLHYFLLINLAIDEANKLVIAYYIPVSIWIISYVIFYLCKSLLRQSKKIILFLRFEILLTFALEAIFISFLAAITFTKGIPLDYIQLMLISKLFLGITISIFFVLPFILLLLLPLCPLVLLIYLKLKKRANNI